MRIAKAKTIPPLFSGIGKAGDRWDLLCEFIEWPPGLNFTNMPFHNSRTACVQALQRWETSTTFADEVLHEALGSSQFNLFDRAFLTETFYGILRHRTALDFLIRKLRDTDLDLQTRQVLRLGFYQIFWMRVPHHAAVNETVNLAGRAKGLVNALLRRAIREKESLEHELATAPTATRYSHPDFLIQRWERQFTPEGAARLCEWDNTPPKPRHCIR